jgi:hypothetical protein
MCGVKGIPGLLASVMQLASPQQQRQSQPGAGAGAPVPPLTAGASLGIPSSADIGDIDSGEDCDYPTTSAAVDVPLLSSLPVGGEELTRSDSIDDLLEDDFIE